MPTPKYARLEHERRVLVAPHAAPPLAAVPYRRIEDHYLDGGRLRLRMIADGATGERSFKLCKKYGSDDPPSEPITNLYLTAEEHAALAGLPGARLVKRRYAVVEAGQDFGLDVFEGELAGLVVCEAEAASREAVLAIAFPAWTSVEVTGDPAFTGATLSRMDRATLAARLRERLGG